MFYLSFIFVFFLALKTISNYLFVYLFCLSSPLKLSVMKAKAVLVIFVYSEPNKVPCSENFLNKQISFSTS